MGVYDDTTAAAQPILGAYFFHPNHLGSVSAVTDYNIDHLQVKVVSEIRYKPYGEKVYSQSSGPDMFRHKYTAQEEDPETSLMYYGARYYKRYDDAAVYCQNNYFNFVNGWVVW